jgi:hypothetical protein
MTLVYLPIPTMTKKKQHKRKKLGQFQGQGRRLNQKSENRKQVNVASWLNI